MEGLYVGLAVGFIAGAIFGAQFLGVEDDSVTDDDVEVTAAAIRKVARQQGRKP